MISRLHRHDTALLIVDVQERLMPSIYEAEKVEKHCTLLAHAARQLQLPVVVTEQYPEKLGRTVPAILEAIDQLEPLPKTLFSACTPAVLETLRATSCSTILLCGVETHVCVLQTALDLLGHGFNVFVAYDAVSSRQESNKQVGWERMMRAGALPTSSESAIFELLREAGTPDFKALLPLLK
ncbi:MAG: hydrolase [Abitibacteriaceae bacterium]|nr:hydrolase [Abditibacteriaceae bacterium]MBV9868017.1 hydrolase [Abditibacteriaceae bacterium]